MKSDHKSFSRFLRIMWISLGAALGLVILFFILISSGKVGFMPSFEELENPKNFVASEIITSDGKVLGKFFKSENRTLAEYSDLSKPLVQALIATEDERFYKHSGIDFPGLIRVVKGILTNDTSSGGGSTISQQLAKLLFPRESNSGIKLVIRKFKEWVIAVKLERSYTKEEILTMYLNKFEFIYGAFGIEVAAQTYFSTTPDSLKLHEAAMLVGMLKNPYMYNPSRNPEVAIQRRNVVLKQMEKNGYIKRDEYNRTKAMPLGTKFNPSGLKSGIAPYFRKYLEVTMIANKPDRSDYKDNAISQQKFFEDSTAWATDPLYGWCNKNAKPNGEPYDLYKDGLRIYATIDYRMQAYAEQSVEAHLKKLQPDFTAHVKRKRNAPFSDDLSDEQANNILMSQVYQSQRYKMLKKQGLSKTEIMKNFNSYEKLSVYTWKGYRDTTMTPLDSIKYYLRNLSSSFMAMDPKTGNVKAWVGGSAYGFTEIDMVRSSTYKRQVGSTCKPFLYTLAMQTGIKPCDKVPNTPQTFILDDGSSWTAKNAGKPNRENELVTISWGLANSVNQVTAWVMKQFSPGAMRSVMRNMGIYSKIDAVPSMFLGTSEITLYEMVSAFGVFANKGIYSRPVIVTKIEDKNGNLISSFQTTHHEALDEQTAYLMTQLLQNVVRQGTGMRLVTTYDVYKEYGGFKTPFAGKTGTTQKQSDGWFIGFTPELVAGVWTGANYRDIHFEGLSMGQASNMALPVFGRFFKKVFADPTLHYTQNFEFEKPLFFNVDINCDGSESESRGNSPESEEYY